MLYTFEKVRNPELRKILEDVLGDVEYRVYGVGTYANLVTALADTTKEVVHLQGDITLEGMLALAHAIEVEGNDNELSDSTLDATQYIAAQITASGVELKDVSIDVSGNSDGNALYCVDVYAAGSKIYNCTFAVANAGSSGSVAIYYEGYDKHELIGNTFSNGVAVTGGAVLTNVRNNTFAAGKGFGLGECTIGGYHYHESDPDVVAAIKAYLIAEGNVTTGEATGLVVEGYYEE